MKVFILQYPVPGTVFAEFFSLRCLCEFQGKETASPVTFAPLNAESDLGKAFLWKCLLKQQTHVSRGWLLPGYVTEIQQTTCMWRSLIGASKSFRKISWLYTKLQEKSCFSCFSYKICVVSYKVFYSLYELCLVPMEIIRTPPPFSVQMVKLNLIQVGPGLGSGPEIFS